MSGALTARSQPSHAVHVRGAAKLVPLSCSVRPLGAVLNVTFTRRGWTTRETLAVAPLESVAVRITSTELFVVASRSSGGGAVNELELPVTGPNHGCVCVAWRRSTVQRQPRSPAACRPAASVALPRSGDRLADGEAAVLAVGLVMTGTGGVLPTSIVTLAGLEVAPAPSRTVRVAV